MVRYPFKLEAVVYRLSLKNDPCPYHGGCRQGNTYEIAFEQKEASLKRRPTSRAFPSDGVIA